MRKQLVTACAFSAVLAGATLQAQTVAIQQLLDATNVDSMAWCLERLTGEVPVMLNGEEVTITSRYTSHPDHALAQQWLATELGRRGFEVTEQPFFVSGAAGLNLIVEKPGLVEPERKVYIGAHYDSMPGAGPAPGADDDGSGVCAVLEAARIMTTHNYERTLVFALWDWEEQGLKGSNYHASAAAAENTEIVGLVQMDMIGYDGDSDGLRQVHVQNVANSVAIADSVLMVNTTYGLELPVEVVNPGITASDHAAFWAQGYGAVLLIEDYTNDFNYHLHTPNDVIANLDMAYWRGNAQLAIGTAAALAIPTTGVGIRTSGQGMLPLPVFPNPARDQATVRFSAPADGACHVTLTDPSGRRLRQWSFPCGSALQEAQLDLTGLVPGSYVVQVATAKGLATQRLVVVP